MFIQLGLVPADLLLMAPDLFLQLLNSVLVMVYLFLMVLGCLLLQLGKFFFLLHNHERKEEGIEESVLLVYFEIEQ